MHSHQGLHSEQGGHTHPDFNSNANRDLNPKP